MAKILSKNGPGASFFWLFFQSGFVPALVNNLLIMGDVLSLLTPEQEVMVRDNLGDVLHFEGDDVAFEHE